jgi:hypothetical protein
MTPDYYRRISLRLYKDGSRVSDLIACAPASVPPIARRWLSVPSASGWKFCSRADWVMRGVDFSNDGRYLVETMRACAGTLLPLV